MALARYSMITVTALAAMGVHAKPVLDIRQSGLTLPTGWSSFGCYSDTTSSRTLKIASFTDPNNMTIESCIAFCTPAGYNFAGLEYARECYCDNIIESGAVSIDAGSCSMACTGNANEICGGADAISIFRHAATSSTTATPTTVAPTSTSTSTPTPTPTKPTVKQSVGTFQYKGCFGDRPANQPRALGTQLNVAGGATAETCTAACKAAGFALAGLEYGQECWCSKYMVLVSKVPEYQCNMPCNADVTELCGGGNFLNVYADSAATPLDPNTCLSNAILFPGAGGVPTFYYNMVMVSSNGSPSVLLGAIFDHIIPINQNVFVLRGNIPTDDGHLFSLSGGAIAANSVWSGFSTVLAAGSPLFFNFVGPYANTLCVKPDPASINGPFIGPPLLGVSGVTNPWAVCGTDPLTPIFSPNSTNGVCSSVSLQVLVPNFA